MTRCCFFLGTPWNEQSLNLGLKQKCSAKCHGKQSKSEHRTMRQESKYSLPITSHQFPPFSKLKQSETMAQSKQEFCESKCCPEPKACRKTTLRSITICFKSRFPSRGQRRFRSVWVMFFFFVYSLCLPMRGVTVLAAPPCGILDANKMKEMTQMDYMGMGPFCILSSSVAFVSLRSSARFGVPCFELCLSLVLALCSLASHGLYVNQLEHSKATWYNSGIAIAVHCGDPLTRQSAPTNQPSRHSLPVTEDTTSMIHIKL